MAERDRCAVVSEISGEDRNPLEGRRVGRFVFRTERLLLLIFWGLCCQGDQLGIGQNDG